MAAPTRAEMAARGVRPRSEHPRVPFRGPCRAFPVTGEEPTRDLAVAAPGERDHPPGVALEQRVREPWHALGAGQVRRTDQPREATVTRLVAGEQHEVGPALAVSDAAQILAHRVAMAREAGPIRVQPHGATRFDQPAHRIRLPRPPRRPRRTTRAPPAPRRHHDSSRVGDRGVEQLDLHAHHGMDAGRLRRGDEPDRAVQALVVGDRERPQPELRRTVDEGIGRRRAVEKRELAVAVELGVPRHGTVLPDDPV